MSSSSSPNRASDFLNVPVRTSTLMWRARLLTPLSYASDVPRETPSQPPPTRHPSVPSNNVVSSSFHYSGLHHRSLYSFKEEWSYRRPTMSGPVSVCRTYVLLSGVWVLLLPRTATPVLSRKVVKFCPGTVRKTGRLFGRGIPFPSSWLTGSVYDGEWSVTRPTKSPRSSELGGESLDSFDSESLSLISQGPVG